MMDFYSCISILFLVADAIAQRYKVTFVDVRTFQQPVVKLHELGVTTEDNRLLFEIKTCHYVNVDFRSTKSWEYNVRLEKSKTGQMKVTIRTSSLQVSSLYNHGQDCNTFIKMKIEWNEGVLVVFSYHVTGWNQILKKHDSLLGSDVIKSITITNLNTAQWKIYGLEHSTSPYNVECITF